MYDKYNEVFKDGSAPKVLAAFVLAKYDTDINNPMLEVISMGTGTKCVTGETIDHKVNFIVINFCRATLRRRFIPRFSYQTCVFD